MPGTLAIDAESTFAAALLMSAGPKPKFGSTTGEIDHRRRCPGLPAEVAVTYHAEPGRRAVSEVITVTIAAQHDRTRTSPPAHRSCSTSCGLACPRPRHATTARGSGAVASGSQPTGPASQRAAPQGRGVIAALGHLLNLGGWTLAALLAASALGSTGSARALAPHGATCPLRSGTVGAGVGSAGTCHSPTWTRTGAASGALPSRSGPRSRSVRQAPASLPGYGSRAP